MLAFAKLKGLDSVVSDKQWAAHEASKPGPVHNWDSRDLRPQWVFSSSTTSLFSCPACFLFLHLPPPPFNLKLLKDLVMMKTISYVIDPDGDIELVLREPSSHQIIPEIHCDGPSTQGDLPDSDFDNPPAIGRYTIFNELYTEPTATTGTQNIEEDNEPREVYMRISSKHLPFVSSTFRDLLHPLRNEDASAQFSACSSSPPPAFRPSTRIYTVGWDAVALAIVLDAIHGRHAEIPRVINLGLLVRITTVVDHYKCQEVIQVFFDHWQRGIFSQDGFPTILCKTALLWLYICIVFPGLEGIFASMACTVLLDFKGSAQITARMLPITTILSKLTKHACLCDKTNEREGKLNEKRLYLIQQIKDGLQDVHNSLLQGSECVRGDRLCTSLTLGVLVHMVHQHEHAEPPFIAPFDGYSVATALKLVTECSEPVPRHGNHGTDMPRYIDPYDGMTYPCSIRGRMTPVVEKVEGELYRMRPADFKD
ncbi:hypothetical protein BFJ72_g2936 [Fusarium proliferatum]|uniref:BTB domain-containing protein n=1 Tax=Gibberella intermedia TaxID=948311 RepID=A0A420TWL4_GIBIN|nr:hypothetical protein BFJ72_g2936 [Fusarium proliferatum]